MMEQSKWFNDDLKLGHQTNSIENVQEEPKSHDLAYQFHLEEEQQTLADSIQAKTQKELNNQLPKQGSRNAG